VSADAVFAVVMVASLPQGSVAASWQIAVEYDASALDFASVSYNTSIWRVAVLATTPRLVIFNAIPVDMADRRALVPQTAPETLASVMLHARVTVVATPQPSINVSTVFLYDTQQQAYPGAVLVADGLVQSVGGDLARSSEMVRIAPASSPIAPTPSLWTRCANLLLLKGRTHKACLTDQSLAKHSPLLIHCSVCDLHCCYHGVWL